MKSIAMAAVFAASLLITGTASADWGDGQDIADQWGGGRTAYGGSGNPYSGGNRWQPPGGYYRSGYGYGYRYRPVKRYQPTKRYQPCAKKKAVRPVRARR